MKGGVKGGKREEGRLKKQGIRNGAGRKKSRSEKVDEKEIWRKMQFW